MLDNAWIIPLIPAASFLAILFFGKRLPRGGSEIGIASVAACFVLAVVVNFQWYDHVGDAGHAGATTEEHAAAPLDPPAAAGRSVAVAAGPVQEDHAEGEEAHASVEPV
ncbi:MAG: hypothetical protein AB7L84_14750, partial [Acidimicrobiia bacterium]